MFVLSLYEGGALKILCGVGWGWVCETLFAMLVDEHGEGKPVNVEATSGVESYVVGLERDVL